MRKQWKADKQNKTNSLPNIIVPHVLLASSMVCDDLVLQSSLHRIGRTEGTLFKLFTKLIFSCYISIFFITHRWIICRFSFCLNSRSLWMEYKDKTIKKCLLATINEDNWVTKVKIFRTMKTTKMPYRVTVVVLLH